MKKFKNHHNENNENPNSEAEESREEKLEQDAETENPEETSAEDDIVEALKDENRKLKEDYLRAYADAENTKKRCAQEIEKNSKYAVSAFAKNLLSVADNLHRALDSVPKDKRGECEGLTNLLKGVELTEADLMKAFEKHGIRKMEIMGQVFDPNFHQVVQEVEDASKPSFGSRGRLKAKRNDYCRTADRIYAERPYSARGDGGGYKRRKPRLGFCC